MVGGNSVCAGSNRLALYMTVMHDRMCTPRGCAPLTPCNTQLGYPIVAHCGVGLTDKTLAILSDRDAVRVIANSNRRTDCQIDSDSSICGDCSDDTAPPRRCACPLVWPLAEFGLAVLQIG